MLRTILGEKKFIEGVKTYLKTFDGQSATIEDFISTMEQVGGVDLKVFENWYHQAGTPKVKVDKFTFDAGKVSVTISQSIPSTFDQPSETKFPVHIPLSISFLNAKGKDLSFEAEKFSAKIELAEKIQTFVFEGFNQTPVSPFVFPLAPVDVFQLSDSQILCGQISSPTNDPFHKHYAFKVVATGLLKSFIDFQTKDISQVGHTLEALHPFHEELAQVLNGITSGKDYDRSYYALLLSLPTVEQISQKLEVYDAPLIFETREKYRKYVGNLFYDYWRKLFSSNHLLEDDLSVSSESMSRRDLKALSLSYLAATEKFDVEQICVSLYKDSNNLTDKTMALVALLSNAKFHPVGLRLLDEDYDRYYKSHSLLVNHWLTLQAASPVPKKTVENVKRLLSHEAFDWNNPNKVYSLIRTFASNPVAFHEGNKGYELLADAVIKLSHINPQVAARLLTAFKSITRCPKHRREAMTFQIERILQANPPKEVYEIAKNTLDAAKRVE